MNGITGEQAYLNLLQYILNHGQLTKNRDGDSKYDTYAIFGSMMQFNLEHTFPLLTTKKMFVRGVIEELLWFISGSTNVNPLKDKNVHIWDEWANAESGELGPVYGHQWRNWNGGLASPEGRDQLQQAIDTIRNQPDSRRNIVTAWNPDDVPKCKLPPCHVLFQFRVADGKLHCALTQRSGDMFLGIPFNIASYSLLTCLVAAITDLKPGTFTHYINDAHIYVNHVDQCQQQIARFTYPAPELELKVPADKKITSFKTEDIVLKNYTSHEAIKAVVAV